MTTTWYGMSVEKVESDEEVTTYAAAKIVNEWLVEKGVDKVLPAQMFYNYTTAKVKAGKKSMIPLNENGKLTRSILREWFNKYYEKNCK